MSDDIHRPSNRATVTPVKAFHFVELRARVEALRAGAGLPAFSWTVVGQNEATRRAWRRLKTASRTASRFWFCQPFSDLFGPVEDLGFPNECGLCWVFC